MRSPNFIESKLCENGTLHISYREGRRSGKGFLDDYANEVFALLALYEATLDNAWLEKARRFCDKAVEDFYDEVQGGFFLYGKENEQLILRPKETYDGAVFSGNSAMAYNLVQLYLITGEEKIGELAERQLKLMSGEAKDYPTGHAMLLVALSDFLDVPNKVTIVLKEKQKPAGLACRLPLNTVICVLDEPTEEYPLKDDRTTYYVCSGRSCLPPVNELDESMFNHATSQSDCESGR